MRQAQQMQENMRKLQDELASVEVEGQSGAGMVKVTMNLQATMSSGSTSIRLCWPTTRKCSRTSWQRLSTTRRSQSRGGSSGKDVGIDRRSRSASRDEAAVLTNAMKSPTALEELIEALRCLPESAPSPLSASPTTCCNTTRRGRRDSLSP